MFRFGTKKPGRAGLRAALLAGATVAALGLGGLSAVSASAAFPCSGSNIVGQGASLQKIAQQNVWGPNFETNVCNKGAHPTVTYNSTGSGGGLKEWNHDGARGSINTALQYIATDDAPTAAQIGNITSVAGGADLLVIPVAQTSITVSAHPPAGCTMEEVTNNDMEHALRGTLTNWEQFATASGSCNAPVKRVVRQESSGTTYQFKNYLYKLRSTSSLPCIGKSWQELEPIEAGGSPNIDWPESCEARTLSPLLRGAGNGGVASTIKSEEGSIGYVALADAEAAGAPLEILELQNNGLDPDPGEASFASPVVGTTANCGNQVYPVPAGARSTIGTGFNVDWSSVFGAKPYIGGSNYPLCALTFVLAFHGYQAAGFTEDNETTVFTYIRRYMVNTEGQSDINGNFYSSLPSSSSVAHNVLRAARFTGGKISW